MATRPIGDIVRSNHDFFLDAEKNPVYSQLSLNQGDNIEVDKFTYPKLFNHLNTESGSLSYNEHLVVIHKSSASRFPEVDFTNTGLAYYDTRFGETYALGLGIFNQDRTGSSGSMKISTTEIVADDLFRDGILQLDLFVSTYYSNGTSMFIFLDDENNETLRLQINQTVGNAPVCEIYYNGGETATLGSTQTYRLKLTITESTNGLLLESESANVFLDDVIIHKTSRLLVTFDYSNTASSDVDQISLQLIRPKNPKVFLPNIPVIEGVTPYRMLADLPV